MTDREDKITGYFSEFPSAHALLDITCKIALTRQRSDAFAFSCEYRTYVAYGEQDRKSTKNRVFVNLHMLVKVAVTSQ